MAKSRNIKVNVESIQNTMRLQSILNELDIKNNIFDNIGKVGRKSIIFNKSTINSILESNILTKNESYAIRILLNKTKIKSLNESTVSKLDKTVNRIFLFNEANDNIGEGLFTDIWNSLKSLGNKAKEAITGGWAKVKGIWTEFKGLVQEVINQAKNGLTTLCNKAVTDAKANAAEMAKTIKNTRIKADPDFVKEMKELSDTQKWWIVTWYNEWVTQPTWEKDVLAGNGTILEEPKVDAAAAEQDMKEIPQLESIMNKRNVLLSDKNVVTELLNLHKKRKTLKESHTVEHLDDAIKNKYLRNIVKYGVELIQWAFIPFAKLGQVVGKWAGPKILNGFSSTTKIFGGPGVYAFELLGTLFGELLEILIKKLSMSFLEETVLNVMFPGFGLSHSVVHGIHNALLLWTIANIIKNLIDTYNKEKGSGGETENAGYVPRGNFKLSEGNLVFIKN